MILRKILRKLIGSTTPRILSMFLKAIEGLERIARVAQEEVDILQQKAEDFYASAKESNDERDEALRVMAKLKEILGK